MAAGTIEGHVHGLCAKVPPGQAAVSHLHCRGRDANVQSAIELKVWMRNMHRGSRHVGADGDLGEGIAEIDGKTRIETHVAFESRSGWHNPGLGEEKLAWAVSEQPAALDDFDRVTRQDRFGALMAPTHEAGGGAFRICAFRTQIEEETGEFLFGFRVSGSVKGGSKLAANLRSGFTEGGGFGTARAGWSLVDRGGPESDFALARSGRLHRQPAFLPEGMNPLLNFPGRDAGALGQPGTDVPGSQLSAGSCLFEEGE